MRVPTYETAMDVISDPNNLIGEGSYRRVFRKGRSKWVFKVDQHMNLRYGNFDEFNTYRRFLSVALPPRIKMPKMFLLRGNIIAAEYISGKHPNNDCWENDHASNCPGLADCWHEITKNIDICDLAPSNVKVMSGKVYLIDLGHGSVSDYS